MVEDSKSEKDCLRSPDKDADVERTTQTETQNDPKWRLIAEPLLIGAMIGINMGQTSVQNFYLWTACTVDLQMPTNSCIIGSEEFHSVEDQSQAVVSSVNISRSFIGAFISTIVLMFVGPWSDCSGRRKPLIIVSLLGMCTMSTALLILLEFPGATTRQVLYAVQIPISVGGNFGLLLTASFSHIGDVCHATGLDVSRTMGLHRAAIQAAHVIGALSGPILYRYLGFHGVFRIVFALQIFSLLYTIFMIKDVNVNPDNTVSVFNWRLPLEAVKCLIKPRQDYRRAIIILMLVVGLGDRVLLSADVLISYMFYRVKFNFEDIMFGSFLAYRNIVSFFGTLLILSVLKKMLKLSDELVGALSCASFIVSSIGLIATHSPIVVFVLPIIGIIAQGSQVVLKPILNKQILPTEQGKIYSLMGALQSATQIFTSPSYALLYASTVSTMPDLWLVPGIFFAAIQVTSFAWSKKLSKKTKYEERGKKNIPLQDVKSKEEVTDLVSKDKSKSVEGVTSS